MHQPPLVLVVDDNDVNRDIFKTRLTTAGYQVIEAADGEEALVVARDRLPDLILLDVMMPKMDGFEVSRRLRADPKIAHIPVIMVTAKAAPDDVVAGLGAGANEYLTKPVDQKALVARVAGMLRLKALQDEVREKAAALADLNRTLEQRVAEQVAALERMLRLKRFLPPQIVDAVLASPEGDGVLRTHRADITVIFTDLRNFTSFAETSEPEDVMRLLGDYYALVGERVHRRSGTIEHFAGDGVMAFLNDPVPCPDHRVEAVRLALEVRDECSRLLARWNKRGSSLGIGIGISSGYATVGTVGFAERSDYAVIGSVANLASRLCSHAAHGQILVSSRVAEEVSAHWPTNQIGEFPLKGFLKPAPIHEVVAEPAVMPATRTGT
jgi:class 3 adenylate cyclase/CheY-like chemotaxis protein